MSTVKKHLPLVAAAAAGAIILVGCSDAQTGRAVPGTGVGATSQTSAPPSSTGTDTALAAIKPCDLLTPQEAAQFKAQGPGQVGDTQASGSTSACGWHGRSASDASVSFGIDIRATQGVDELRANGGTITDGKVNSRSARQLQTVNAGCILTLAVTPNSRVDVSVVVVGDDNSTQSCQIASNIANIVEPKLPPEAN
jgi:hypothetical protein